MHRLVFEVGLRWLARRRGVRVDRATRAGYWAVARYLPAGPFLRALGRLPASEGLPPPSRLWRQVGLVLIGRNRKGVARGRSGRARARARAWLEVQRRLLQ
jgi:hypothetical protein